MVRSSRQALSWNDSVGSFLAFFDYSWALDKMYVDVDSRLICTGSPALNIVIMSPHPVGQG